MNAPQTTEATTRAPELVMTFIQPPDWARPNPDLEWDDPADHPPRGRNRPGKDRNH